MSIKRFQEVIGIISSNQSSTEELHSVQCEINKVIHYNLYNFMLPHKVKELIEVLTPLFVKMKGLKPQPPKVEEKRTELLRQGREIISKLKPYLNAEYSKEEYAEVYTLQYKRLVAEYLKEKKELNISKAVDLLNRGKSLKKECEGIVGEVKNKSFDSMLVELKTYISQQL